jgi:hypothetical protein
LCVCGKFTFFLICVRKIEAFILLEHTNYTLPRQLLLNLNKDLGENIKNIYFEYPLAFTTSRVLLNFLFSMLAPNKQKI